MNTDSNNNLFSLTIAAVVLVTLNVLLWMGVENGQLTPLANTSLWGIFVVLDIASLLWAFSLLGLQPMVLAFSYAVGGYLAYRGVQGATEIGIAEATTAGATYAAVGAMVVGNATTKIRLSFFRKEQVPFVFIFIAVLVLNGVLNSRIPGASRHVVLNALVYPFVIAGIAVGLGWMVVARMSSLPKREVKVRLAEEADPAEETQVEGVETEVSEPAQLIIQVPENSSVEEDEVEPVMPVQLEVSEPEPEVSVPSKESATVEPVEEEQFFPLEIDKDDEFLDRPDDTPDLMDLSALITEDPICPVLTPEPSLSTFVDIEPVVAQKIAELEPIVEPEMVRI
jgi:hypothetical protein